MLAAAIITTKLLEMLPDAIMNWITNFLTDRPQNVMINDKISSRLSTSISVVQGFVLGPFLFLMYALTLRAKSLRNTSCKYAEDCSLLVSKLRSS